jgi:hypothetical protein
MRTTLTLDDDIAAALRRFQQTRKLGLKAAVNELLRLGLLGAGAPRRRRKRYRLKPVRLARCRLPSLDNIGEVLTLIEGEPHR